MEHLQRPKVKICGITRSVDVKVLNKRRPDFAGFIFYRKSPRFVSLKLAKELCETLSPSIIPVAVFVQEPLERIVSTCRSLRTAFAQVHGLTRRDIQTLKRSGLRVIEGFHIQAAPDWSRVRRSAADFALVDNRTATERGGTGRRFDWSLTPRARVENLVLAGGLTAENYLEGVEKFAPAILDFNSGVESAPGKKSAKKIAALFESLEQNLY